MVTSRPNENNTSFSYEELYRLALDHYPGSIIILDCEGNILYCNDTSAKMLGVTKEYLQTTNMYTVVHAGIAEASAGIEVIETKAKQMRYIKNKRGDGMLISSVPVLSEKRDVALAITYSQEEEYLNTYLSWMQAEKDRVNSAFKFVADTKHNYGTVVLQSSKIKKIYEYAYQLAPTSSTVAIYGASGVGKEVLALFIHNSSKRAEHIFLPVNCAAIPPELVESEFFGHEKGAFTGALREGKAGLFEIANSGTIFLDEIGELPLTTQVKLLRVLENGEVRRVGGSKTIKVDTRIICATNRDMREMVANGKFREDLYYRLNVLPIYIPPLRDRVEDIPGLVLTFLSEFNRKNGCSKNFSPEALEEFKQYSWPGNVRELRNVVERMVITSQSNIIELDQNPIDTMVSPNDKAVDARFGLAHEFTLGNSLKMALHSFERQYIEETIKACGGDISLSAQKLDIHVSGLYKKIKDYQIQTKLQSTAE